MINNLVGDAAVVLQDVIVGGAGCRGELLDHGQDLAQLVVGDVSELGAVELGDDELGVVSLVYTIFFIRWVVLGWI